MEQTWTELFYQETDAGKRQALLAQNSEKTMDCQVWKEKSEERYICRLSYGTEVSVGRVDYRFWRQKKKAGSTDRQHAVFVRHQ